MQDLYRTLKLNREDKPSQEQIKKQYLILAQEYHPDRHSSTTNFDSSQFVELVKAYEILKDTKMRRVYDQEIENLQYQTNKSSFWEISEFIRLSDMELVNEQKFVWHCRCSSFYELELNDIMGDAGDITFDSITVQCNGCSLKIKVVNDADDDGIEEHNNDDNNE